MLAAIGNACRKLNGAASRARCTVRARMRPRCTLRRTLATRKTPLRSQPLTFVNDIRLDFVHNPLELADALLWHLFKSRDMFNHLRFLACSKLQPLPPMTRNHDLELWRKCHAVHEPPIDPPKVVHRYRHRSAMAAHALSVGPR